MEYDKERLIEIVHSKPALWDKRTSQYQNRNLKQKEWKDVNKILGGKSNIILYNIYIFIILKHLKLN